MENDAEHWRRLADKLDGPTKCVFAPEIAALREAADTVDRLRKDLAERNEYGYSQQTVDALTHERDRLQARIATLEALALELCVALDVVRAELHAQGRRPEECYAMSVIDNARSDARALEVREP